MPDMNIPAEAEQRPQWRPHDRSPQLGEFFAAVAKAQGEIEGAKKDSTNPHFKSSYADLASARDAVQEPLSKNGLALIQWPRTVEGGVEIETWLGHASGQFMSGTLWMPCGKMDAHGVGSAITYGRRYALMAVTGVAPVDDDGNGAVEGHKPGAPGSAGGGGDFRPAGPRTFRPNNGAEARAEAQRDGLVDATKTKPLPGAPAQRGNANGPEAQAAIKRIEWVKAAIAGFDGVQSKDELTAWWRTEAERLAVIENALPSEYERLLAAYDSAMDRVAARAA